MEPAVIRYGIGIVVLAVLAYVAQVFLPSPVSSVAGIVLGLGAVVCAILLVVALIRGAGPRV